jgi:RHS repeat-associated protein
VNNPAGQVTVNNSFDFLDRIVAATHSHIGVGDPNNVTESTQYDGLGRILAVTHPDGQKAQTAFGSKIGNLGGLTTQQSSTATYGVGYPVISVDEAGKLRQEWINGFGHVIEVDEPGATGGLSSPLVTTYLYDVLGNLTSVIQGVQSRTYTYDGLSRLTQETTPEGGTVTLSYLNSSSALCSGAPSNPCTRTDARGIVTTYTYDAANRLTGKSYSDSTPAVSYLYGTSASAFNIGRLRRMGDGGGSEVYTYDKSGRTTSVAKALGATTYTTGYQYNVDGELTQLTYPSGRIVQYSYDAVGNLCAVAPTTTGCGNSTSPYLTIASSAYDAAGRPLTATYGNGVSASATYNPQTFELATLGFTKGTTTLFALTYFYQNDSSNCPTGASGNNGQIQCIQDTVQPGRSVNYTYDPLGRLLTAGTTGSVAYPAWGLSETYDRYGNRPAQAVTAGSGFNSSLTINPANNQIAGYTYDASGDIITEPAPLSTTFTYTAEGCIKTYTGNGSSATYACDGNNGRPKKTVTGTNAITTVYIRSGGDVIAEYDNGAAMNSPTREYIFGSQRLATVVGSVAGSGGTITYEHPDHLSPRLLTDSNGNDVGEQGTYPFGESWYNNSSTSHWVFTTYERDQESGNDYALAREYEESSARFLSPDPLEGIVGDPQSWNRYAYVENDPIDITDPSGQGFWSDLLNFFEALLGLNSDNSNILSVIRAGVPCGNGPTAGTCNEEVIATLVVGLGPAVCDAGVCYTGGGSGGGGVAGPGSRGSAGSTDASSTGEHPQGGGDPGTQSATGGGVTGAEPSPSVAGGTASGGSGGADYPSVGGNIWDERSIIAGSGTITLYKGIAEVAAFPYTTGLNGDRNPRDSFRGPTPPGIYYVNAKEISPAGFFRKYIDPRDWGDYRVPLHPLAGTNTYGRNNFFIHGGLKRPGSEGCIKVEGPNQDTLFTELKKARGLVQVIVY